MRKRAKREAQAYRSRDNKSQGDTGTNGESSLTIVLILEDARVLKSS